MNRVLSDSDDYVREIWATAAVEGVASDDVSGDASIIQLVNTIVTQSVRDRASDIHIEPTDGRVRVRYRIDGSMREMLSLPASAGPELVSRIKVMADMDIVERRRSQDGQFPIVVDGANVEVRISTGATIWGEIAVLRLIDKSRPLTELKDLGMPADSYERFRSIVHKPHGLLVCSGPTGSGKTTTLYATLAEINRKELNVTTIEDPVEYVFSSVNQTQINPQAEVTFASGLQAILRQDPDVILVGEIRDEETAQIAVRAARTGHLVMTSLDATDASSALFRLLDMGIDAFPLSSSLVGVVGQCLVRKICPSCTAPYQPSDADLATYERLGGGPKQEFARGLGCNYCSQTGYRDRIGVYEVMEITDEVRQLVIERATPHEVRVLAAEQGMRSMGTEAMALVADDVTTIDEVIRTISV